MRRSISLLTLATTVVTLAGAGSALAEEAILLTGETENFPVVERTAFADGVIDEIALSGERGGASDTHLSEIRAIGTVREVSASDLVTGHNIVSDGALAGASGIPMFIQNTGNGVLIQNAVIVNVQVQ